MDVNNSANSSNISNNASMWAAQGMNNVDNATMSSPNNDARKRLLSESPIIFIESQTLKTDGYAKRKRQSSKEKEMFCLLISNIPYGWTHAHITEFIEENCSCKIDGIKVLETAIPDSGQSARIWLSKSFEECNMMRKQLKLKTVDGHKLNVAFIEPSDSSSDSECSTMDTLLVEKSEIRPPVTTSPWQQAIDIYSPDPAGLYGLKAEFLEALGVTPPLGQWVHVSNFRCDKSELKEVLELAGHVVLCNVITINKKFAQVMYSHPLEAVQAVSMLNGQLYYGQVLKITMYPAPNSDIILPKGLSSIGPGLGKLGKPLRDVAREYERHLYGKSSSVDPTNFEVDKIEKARCWWGKGQSCRKSDFTSNTNVQDIKLDESLKIETVVSLKKQKNTGDTGSCSAANRIDLWPVTQSNFPVTNTCQGIPNAVRFTPPVEGCLQATPPRTPLIADHGPRFGSLPNPGQIAPNHWRPVAINNTHPAAVPGTYLQPNVTCTVELSNLPLTTTFPLLSEKMAYVGQVLALELTRTGCAVVRFANPAQAENCYKQYNNMCALGNTITVKFI